MEVCTPLQPELEESDYGAAFDLLLRRQVRRALVVVLSDVGDEDASRTLLVRLLGLRPRHLPLLVALADGALTERAQAVPAGPDEAYARVAAARLLKEREGVLWRPARGAACCCPTALSQHTVTS